MHSPANPSFTRSCTHPSILTMCMHSSDHPILHVHALIWTSNITRACTHPSILYTIHACTYPTIHHNTRMYSSTHQVFQYHTCMHSSDLSILHLHALTHPFFTQFMHALTQLFIITRECTHPPIHSLFIITQRMYSPTHPSLHLHNKSQSLLL